jgi:hypothetical protein
MLARCAAVNARTAEAVRRAEAALATAQDRLRQARATLAAIGEMTAVTPHDRAGSV